MVIPEKVAESYHKAMERPGLIFLTKENEDELRGKDNGEADRNSAETHQGND